MSEITDVTTNDASQPRVNWRQVGLFVGLTLGLTWLLDLALWVTSGYRSQAAVFALQLQMLLPAFCAIVLGLFVFPTGDVRSSTGRARAFFWLYLGFFAVYAGMTIAAATIGGQMVEVSPGVNVPFATILAGVGQSVMLLALIATVALRFARGRESFLRAGLKFGKARYWLVYGLGFVLFYVVQAWLNSVFNLGKPVDLAALAGPSGMDPGTLTIVAGIQSVIVAPFLALLVAFGEEYGWRGYLQGELIKLGRVRGVLIVGLIWGVWHAPIIAMGHNYPGHPVAGVLLFTVYCVGLAYILAYAVLKSGSVWLAAFLHAINNQVLGYLFAIFYAPTDNLYSFGVGVYGVLSILLVAALILRDPVWKE